MGFFKDLREDISQVVNELLPDDAFWGLEEDSTEGLVAEDESEAVENALREMEPIQEEIVGKMDTFKADEEEILTELQKLALPENEDEKEVMQEDMHTDLESLGLEDIASQFNSDMQEDVVHIDEGQDANYSLMSEKLTEEERIKESKDEKKEEDDFAEAFMEAKSLIDGLSKDTADDVNFKEFETENELENAEKADLTSELDNMYGGENEILEEGVSNRSNEVIIELDEQLPVQTNSNILEELSQSQFVQPTEDCAPVEENIQDSISFERQEGKSIKMTSDEKNMEFVSGETKEEENINKVFEEVKHEEEKAEVAFEEVKGEKESMETVSEEEKEQKESMETVSEEEKEQGESMEVVSEEVKEKEKDEEIASDENIEEIKEQNEDFGNEPSKFGNNEIINIKQNEEAQEGKEMDNVEGLNSTDDFATDTISAQENATIEENIIEKEVDTMENNLANAEVKDEVTVITKGTVINGSISSDGSLEVNGTITGDVECLGKLSINGNVSGHLKAAEVVVSTPRLDGGIESHGDVKVGVGTIVLGDVSAKSATISGAVKGEIDVNGPVVVDSTAIVKGNITAKSVQINNGAVVDGYCKLSYAEVDIDNFFEEN